MTLDQAAVKIGEALGWIAAGAAGILGFKKVLNRNQRHPAAPPPEFNERRAHVRRDEWETFLKEMTAMARLVDQHHFKLEQIWEEREEQRRTLKEIASDIKRIEVKLAEGKNA